MEKKGSTWLTYEALIGFVSRVETLADTKHNTYQGQSEVVVTAGNQIFDKFLFYQHILFSKINNNLWYKCPGIVFRGDL